MAAATTPGDHNDWPAAWATDALRRAVNSQAYPSDLTDGRVKVSAHGDDDSVLATIAALTKSAYVTSHTSAAQAQLVK